MKIKIEKLVYGGHGMGRDDDGVIFVSGTAAGEVVEYEGDGMQGGVRLGRVTRIIEPSAKRRVPPCKYAGECGGCDWIHLEYDEQVRCKKEIFLDCIKRIGKFDDHPDDIDVFTADEFGYRSRAQIKIDHLNKCAGFFKRKTNDVVRIDRCPLLADDINDVLAKLNTDTSIINTIPQDINTIKILSGKTVASYPAIEGLTDAKTKIGVGDITFLADGGSFFQSNKFLLSTMGRWFADNGGKVIGMDPGNKTSPLVNRESVKYKLCLDLYGGIGFFSLMLSDVFEEVILVESVPAQVRAAEKNFRHNKKNHLSAVLADIDKITDFSKITNSRRPDCIIIDPPRPGLTKSARKLLIDTAAPTILYVSCNPSTFARDAGALVSGGYELTRWALFDLYPNTHHIESAAVFRRA